MVGVAAGGGAPWVGEGAEADWAVWDGHGAEAAGLCGVFVDRWSLEIIFGAGGQTFMPLTSGVTLIISFLCVTELLCLPEFRPSESTAVHRFLSATFCHTYSHLTKRLQSRTNPT